MTTHEALLRLARNRDDGEALISIYEQSEREVTAAIIRWLGLEDEFERARRGVLLDIALTARFYLPEVHDATDWIRERTNLECRRIYFQCGRGPFTRE